MAYSSEEEEDPNRFEDAEDDMAIAVPSAPSTSDAVHVQAVPVAVRPQPAGARGKPEAAAAALAAAKRDTLKQELESTATVKKEDGYDDDDEDEDDAVAVVAEPVESAAAADAKAVAPETPKAKPPPKKKARKTPAKKSPASTKSKSKAKSSPAIDLLMGPTIDNPVEPMTDVDYENLIALMEHFCKVPLLAEFSRPVSLLHPELVSVYNKIVSHPVDLGKVCRKIRKREYKNTREVQLDMWRIFSNCVKYHMHPSNKEAVPSFVSISLHLREFFEALWQEHMLPSDPPPKATSNSKTVEAKYLKETYTRRDEHRKMRLIVSGLTCLSPNCMKKSAYKLDALVKNQGILDRLDKEPLFPDSSGGGLGPGIDEDDKKDLQLVAEKLLAFKDKLIQIADANEEYTVEQFDQDLKQCYTVDVFENNPRLIYRVRNRMNRFLGKVLVPINEANCRGVTQSSIWACMAAAIWARESSKKPYWPALVLGIKAPDDQKEDWHWALTDRNELRLPPSLRTQLSAGKRKAELAIRRQSQGHADPQSFFLVEFLGTHEFIWVRETDIVESFDPEDDPNVKASASKKKRSGRASNASVVGSKKYQTAVEEAKWALEEFEIQLQDACGEIVAPEEDDQESEDGNYSYNVLCVSDDEADEVYSNDNKDDQTSDDIEEANELIATRGLIDFSATGRKNAKKRAQALKKQKLEAEKKEKLAKQKKQKQETEKKKRKESVSSKTQEREDKKDQKELEKRRKKRSRERERAMKMTKKAQAPKRRRVSTDEEDQRKSISGENLVLDKRARATAIVNGYLIRMAEDDEYKSLGLAGIMSIPAAMVDSSGLLGMSLAFRAAAGELTMPEESGEQEQKKPWDAIDVEGLKKSSERTERLRQQAELLEKEIERVKSATERRLKVAEEADIARQQLDRDIAQDEAAARMNPFMIKKKKKVPDSATKSVEGSPSGKSEHEHEAEDMKDANAKQEGETETPSTSKEAEQEVRSPAKDPPAAVREDPPEDTVMAE